jgi:hypothetical protein
MRRPYPLGAGDHTRAENEATERAPAENRAPDVRIVVAGKELEQAQ